jgi:hypothetical protein|tara:strand:+ start:699 stop:926 length:228 start_codon:yes stop_codon:yes gene_type:complete
MLKIKHIEDVERLANTRNGNARYLLTCTDGSAFRTQPNAMWVCAMVPHALIGAEVELDINENGVIQILPHIFPHG